jgi:hypothetical protein
VGSTTPGTWNAWLLAQGSTIQLWSMPIPVVSPAKTFNVPIPGFPSVGNVFVITTLTTTGGASCVDWKGVNTGP